MKCCELVAPSRVSVVSSKLESSRENSLRTQIDNLKGVFDGGDDTYTKVYYKSLLNDFSEMVGIKTYANKIDELHENLKDIINNLDFGYDRQEMQKEFLRMLEDAKQQSGQWAVPNEALKQEVI